MLIFKLRLLSHALNARTSSIEKINVVLKRYRTDYLVFKSSDFERTRFASCGLYYYHWVGISDGGLLVLASSNLPLVSVLALTWTKRYSIIKMYRSLKCN